MAFGAEIVSELVRSSPTLETIWVRTGPRLADNNPDALRHEQTRSTVLHSLLHKVLIVQNLHLQPAMRSILFTNSFNAFPHPGQIRYFFYAYGMKRVCILL